MPACTHSRARFLLGTAISLSCASLAAAQDAAETEPGAFQLDPIYVENRDIFAGAADRATSMYVSDFELERARTGDLKDVFAGIASVSVGGALPLTQKIYVNGVDMLNLGVTIDGAAQNNRAFHHVTANAIDPGLLKQVRVDATVSPADAGPFALAGSVVFETVDPEDILEPGKTLGGNVRLSFSDNGATFQSALTLAGQTGGLSTLAYVKRAAGDDYESGAGETIEGTAADLESFLGKVAYETETGHRFELSGQTLRDKNDRQFRANFGGLGDVTDDLRVYDTERQSYSFIYENTLTKGLWDPRVTVGYSSSDIKVPEPWDSNGFSDTWSATAENTFNLSELDTITAGFDVRRSTGEYSSPTYGERYEELSTNFGAFVQARLQPVDRLKLSVGARADVQEFEGVNGDTQTNSGLSANASAVYALTDTFSVRGGASTVFGGVVIEDNYTYLPSWEYDDLKPARADNATVGFDWALGPLALGGELFLTQIDNARSGVENFDFESRGFNLGATYGWASGFARATLSHSDVEVDGEPADGYQTLDFGAPLGTVIALEIEQQTPVAGLVVGGGMNAALDYDMPDSATSDLESYEVVNLFAEYTPARFDRLTVRAEIDNLFDKEYGDRATYGGDFDSVITLKEPGRTLSLVGVIRF